MKKTMPQKSNSVKHEQGLYITNGVILHPHEQKTVNFLLNLGYKVELIPPSNTPHTKRPDIIMKGVIWEMKSPDGKSKYTIEHIIRKATHQSPCLVLDLRRIRVNQSIAIQQAKYEFNRRKTIKHLWIITREGQLFKFAK